MCALGHKRTFQLLFDVIDRVPGSEPKLRMGRSGERSTGNLKLKYAWMVEIIEYRGYRLHVGPVGKGWRASIYSPDCTSALPDSPTNLEKSRKDEIIAEAKRIIDERFASRSKV